MKKRLLLLLLLLCGAVHAQHYFKLNSAVQVAEIPFEEAANLIIVPAIFNGKPTKFILDTGTEKTLLFNWNNIDTLAINVKNTIKITGYGERKFLDVFYTDDNVINLGAVSNHQAEAYVLVDEVIDLKPQFGIFVNGLLGADFFKNLVVAIDYAKNVVRVYKDIKDVPFSLNKFERMDLFFENNKPFINASLINNNSSMQGNYLIDTGSSDALWCFNIDVGFEKPKKFFEDYLGFGVNGAIYGKRTKIDQLKIRNFYFDRVATAFPEIEKAAYKELKSRAGSIGGELLRRFQIIFDYKNTAMYLKPSKGFDDPFYFNLAGIQLLAGKNNLFTRVEKAPLVKDSMGPYGVIKDQVVIESFVRYVYHTVPELYVSYVRKNSPAEAAGLKPGDVLAYINGLKDERLTLDAVNDIFFRDVNKTVSLRVKRQGEILKFKFKQVPLID